MIDETLSDKIDELLKGCPPVLLAIDGDCASGKSTLAERLRKRHDCNVISMDHFFLRPEQRTTERLAEPGGNVDYERFFAEVLTPLKRGESFTYKPFNCQTGDFSAPITVKPRKLSIVEGAYSLHPSLADAYHIRVFLTVDPAEQLKRIAARNGPEMLARFRDEWIPMEKRYFAHFDIADQCDFVGAISNRPQANGARPYDGDVAN